MPEFPIVDCHLHIWDPRRFRMPWLDDNEVLDRPYGLAEYRAASTGPGVEVEAVVYIQVEVETPCALLETRWAVDQAERDDRMRTIVPWAPLEHGEQVRVFLDYLVDMSPLIRGVRRIIQFEPDLDFCLQPRFVRGVQLLSEYDLSFDICIDHRHLANVIKLVDRCPDTAFVLDHIGKPDIAGQLMDPWRSQIKELASFPNVSCKVSGLVTEADRERWRLEDLRPYVQHVLETFGEDRVMFGGDWPVVLQASPYLRWVRSLEELTASSSLRARRGLWADNARRFYRIDDRTSRS